MVAMGLVWGNKQAFSFCQPLDPISYLGDKLPLQHSREFKAIMQMGHPKSIPVQEGIIDIISNGIGNLMGIHTLPPYMKLWL